MKKQEGIFEYLGGDGYNLPEDTNV